MKIMIIDCNVLFREGLVNLLQREPGISVVGEADSIFEAVGQVNGAAPDLIMIDSELSELQEYNGLRLLRVQCPQAQLVLMCTHESDELMLYAVRNGARGILTKNNSLSRLMASIHALERGEAVIPRAMVGRLLDEFHNLGRNKEHDSLGTLTGREIEVLRELGKNHSNRQIAEQLKIAENTVKVHVHNLLEKLDLRNRRQAARFARAQGLHHERNH